MEETTQSVINKDTIQKEVVDSLPQNPHGILLLAPRIGKTKITIDLLKRDKPLRILWVTESDQLKEAIKSEFELWDAKLLLSRTVLSTYRSLHKVIGTFDTIILDEYQFCTKANTVNLLNKTLRYLNILAMSGTKPKNESKRFIYEELKLYPLADYSLNKAVDEGILSDYTLNVVKITPNVTELAEYCKTQHLINRNVYGTYTLVNNKMIVENVRDNSVTEYDIQHIPERDKDNTKFYMIYKNAITAGYLVMANENLRFGKMTIDTMKYQIKNRVITKPVGKFLLIKRARDLGSSPLKTRICKSILDSVKGQRNIIFCQTVEQAEKISTYTYHGKTTSVNFDKFQNEEITELAMVKKGGVGTTYRNIDNLIIVHLDNDNTGNSMQRLSRTLLKQQNYKANIWVLCIKDTLDEDVVANFVNKLDEDKVNYIEYENQ